ncbi:hypothetical protein FRC19_003481 [Serendipita sp. 401]|nr:hypothetical protein FRC19_003481 [Serendipita sp. 401]
MAEAIGLGLSIFALVKLGAVVLNTCYDYVAKAKNAPEDIQRIISEVGSLQTILEQLQRLTSDPDEEKMTLLKSLEGPNGPFKACYDVLDEIQKKLQSIKDVASLRRRLLFPFEGPKLNELLHTLEKHKTSFILAIAGDNVKATSNVEKKVDNVSNRLEDMKALEYRKEVLQWLKGADPTTNHNTARKKHEPGTGEWLLDSKEFKSWMEEDGKIMWLNGIPGAGKTVLSSTVIENLILHCKTRTGDRVAYYYFDFSDHGKQTTSGCLQSLIRQLCEQSDTIPVAVKELHADCKSTTPSLSQLTSTLIGIMNYGPKYFIAIDALDECKEEEEEHERESFFEALQEIISSTTGRYSVFIASRPEIDISRNLTELGALNFNIQRNLVDADIRSHVRACLEKEIRFKKWPIPVKTQVEDKLTAGANGMFRWAVCQLDSLKRCLKPANALRELETLPKTLEETYSRILKRVPSVYEREMKSILLLLAFSTRPMTIQEVAEATAVNLENRSFSTDERFPDAYDILELCSSLVSLVDLGSDSASILRKERMNVFNWPPETKIIHFAHFSVKEYIISERARKMVSPSLVITPSTSQLHIAEMCLIYLLDFNGGKATTNFDHSEYPLLAYAALHWMTHLASMEEADLAAIEDLLLRLFDPDDSANLMNCLNLYDPVSRYTLRQYGDQTRTLGFTVHRNKQDFETPLYYACYYGLLPIVEALLGKLATRRRSAEELGTALEAAASGGYVAIVRRLLEEGADPNAPYCRKFHRPLHAGASSGSVEIVELLLAAGADVNASGGEFGTALHVAARHGSSEIIQLLIDNGHDVNPWVQMYGTALTLAARHGHDGAIMTLLKNGANPNVYGGAYLSALNAAAEHARVDAVRALLDAGAEIKLDQGRDRALHEAAERAEISIMRLLIARGADINAPGGTYGTPLKSAIQSRDDAAFAFMLENGADINERGSTSKYPIDQAIFGGNLKAADKLLELGGKFGDGALNEALDYHTKEYLVKTLLDRGADPNAFHKKHGNVLQFAVYGSRHQAIRWLLEAGADVNAVEGEYGTALQAATAGKNESIVLLLLEFGAKVNLPCCGKFGNPLQAAARMGKMSLVQLLIDRGADINARGGRYETALQGAAAKGDETIVRLLLSKKADVNIVGGDYQTALRAAAAEGHEGIVKLLLAAGADINITTVGEHTSASDPYSITSFRSTLEVAVASGNIAIVQLLLDHGMDINASEESCSASLSHAAALPTTTMLEFLIDQGADVKLYGGMVTFTAANRRKIDPLKLLIRHGANINYCTQHSGSALQECAHMGHREIMELLLESGADVNAQGGFYGTALQRAIESGKKEISMELLRRGADVNAKAGKWGTALSMAARKGDEEMVRELLQRGADVNLTHGYHSNALQAAIDGDYYEMANELLDKGADPSVPGVHGTALISACGYGKVGQIQLVKRILSYGVDIEAVDPARPEDSATPGTRFYVTALQYAAYAGNEAVARLLIEAGANVNMKAGTWGYALQVAAKRGHHEVVTLLLENGADINAVGGEFGTALQAAANEGNDTVVSLLLENGADVNIEAGLYGSPLQAVSRLGKLRHVQLFLERGAKINTTVGHYGAPLHAAAKRGNDGVVKLLLEHGADVNLMCGKHGSALQAACCGHSGRTENIRTIELLLKHGANVNQEGGKWGTALQAAAYHHYFYVEILLRHGADPNLKGGRFGSPLEAARKKGLPRVARLLIQHGAREDT